MTAALASAGVQYGSVTIASGATTGTTTVTAVGSGAFLLYNGQKTAVNTASPSTGLARLSISGTTVTATRNASTTAAITVYFCLVDGDTTNLIKSVQYGTINFGTSLTGTAAISAVTTANTAVHFLGFTHTATSTTPISQWPALSLTSPTQVTATVGSAPGTNAITVGFVAIEFQGAALNSSVQAISDTASPGATTRTHTISSVTLANTLLIWAGQLTTGGASYASGDQYGQLTAATTLTIGTNTAPNVSITDNFYVVELVSGLVETGAQRGNIAIAGATSGTAALSPSVTLADAVMTYGGNQTSGTTFDTRNVGLSALSTSQVTASNNTNSTTKTGWEVIGLNPAAASATFVNWLATFPDQVGPPPKADRFSAVAQKVQPSPISQTDWYAFYNPEVNPQPKAAQFSWVAPKTLPSPIAQNDFYPACPSEVAPQLEAAGFSVWPNKILPSPIAQTNWHPVYDPQIKPYPPRASHYAQLLPTPIGIINWEPGYEAQVKPFLPRAGFSSTAHLLPAPIGQTDWYCFFDPTVKPWKLNSQNSFIAEEILPGPIALNSYYPSYAAEVRIAAPNNVGYSAFPTPVVPASFTPISWYPGFDAKAGAARAIPQSVFAGVLFAPVSLTSWYPAFQPEVRAAPGAARHGYFSQTPASPLSPTDWCPTFAPEVKGPPPRTAYSYHAELLPAPLAFNNWCPTYSAEVKGAPLSALFSYFAERLPAPIAANNFYPAYDPQVTPAASRAGFSALVELLAAPTTINGFYPVYSAELSVRLPNIPTFVTPAMPDVNSVNWYPSYPPEPALPPRRSHHGAFAELRQAALNTFYPVYAAEVKRQRLADRSVFTLPIFIITAPPTPPDRIIDPNYQNRSLLADIDSRIIQSGQEKRTILARVQCRILQPTKQTRTI